MITKLEPKAAELRGRRLAHAQGRADRALASSDFGRMSQSARAPYSPLAAAACFSNRRGKEAVADAMRTVSAGIGRRDSEAATGTAQLGEHVARALEFH